MKDFPCFATDDGVASLILKEIPYRQEAYIRFQDVQPGRFAPFLEECVSFCRMAGAEKIYAQGHGELARYPLHAAVYEMRGKAWVDTALLENIFPVTEATAETWRRLCNARMRGVDCAATQTAADEKEILAIVASRKEQAHIMEEINRLHGLRSSPQAVVIGLPIDHMAKLN